MKRILIIAAILVLLPVAGWGQHWAFMGGTQDGPAWGDYIFAYDASFSPDGVAFTAGGVRVQGTTTSTFTTFSGEKAWSSSNATHRALWNVSDVNMQMTNVDGITIWTRIYINDGDVGTSMYLSGVTTPNNSTVDNNVYTYINPTGDLVTSVYIGNGSADNKASALAVANTSWTEVGLSFIPGGNLGVSRTKDSGWEEDPDTVVAFSNAATSVFFGRYQGNNTGESFYISKMVILRGYKKPCPW